MKPIYRWTGRYFGFVHEGFLFTASGRYVGWVEKDTAWTRNGQYLGRLVEDTYILRSIDEVPPPSRRPRLPDVRPIVPNPSLGRPPRHGLQQLQDALDRIPSERELARPPAMHDGPTATWCPACGQSVYLAEIVNPVLTVVILSVLIAISLEVLEVSLLAQDWDRTASAVLALLITVPPLGLVRFGRIPSRVSACPECGCHHARAQGAYSGSNRLA